MKDYLKFVNFINMIKLSVGSIVFYDVVKPY